LQTAAVESLQRSQLGGLNDLQPVARVPGEPPILHLKVAFPVGSRGVRNEWMWVQVVFMDDTQIEGVLVNEPRRRTDLRAGSYVAFTHDQVADYLLRGSDGGYEGNALKVLLDHGFGLYAPAVGGTSAPK